VYEIYPGSNLYRSIWAGNKEDRRSLGHKDRELAITQAHELIAALRSLGDDLPPGEITLHALKLRYCAGKKHARKKPLTRREDEKKLDRVITFLGPNRRAASIDEEDILVYVDARKTGEAELQHVRRDGEGKVLPVRNRTIEADLVALDTMLNWACARTSSRGIPLLAANPIKAVSFPKESNPRRPIVTEDDFEQLLERAAEVHRFLPAAIILANDTGHRVSQCRQLRWRNIRFNHEDFGAIHWPGDTNKEGIELFRPISRRVREALLALRPQVIDPDAPIFPSPRNASEGFGRRQFTKLLMRAYVKADLEPQPGGAWHPFRRKWVTERKGYPLADIAAAGGWRDERSLKSYMQDDPETVRKVVLEPTHQLRRREGDSRSE
jgi:integrase